MKWPPNRNPFRFERAWPGWKGRQGPRWIVLCYGTAWRWVNPIKWPDVSDNHQGRSRPPALPASHPSGVLEFRRLVCSEVFRSVIHNDGVVRISNTPLQWFHPKQTASFRGAHGRMCSPGFCYCSSPAAPWPVARLEKRSQRTSMAPPLMTPSRPMVRILSAQSRAMNHMAKAPSMK
jgi:hypothetical protein